jgi:16S rRNA (cytidine1402-2'-O)-methyltransferase
MEMIVFFIGAACKSRIFYVSLCKRNLMQASLFLIPVTLGDTEHRKVLPEYNREAIRRIRHFIVEDRRSARRFLKQAAPEIVIDTLTFYELNKHTSPEDVVGYLKPLSQGEHVGVISEAGCPAIADPGAEVVAIAQRKNYPVVPLVGPSAILLSLMASGFNGQNFAFNGYLPIDANERLLAIKKLEARVYADDQTQLFIETPYRNNKLTDDLIRICRPSTKLCIASNLTCEDESVRTLPMKEWAGKTPDLNKQPAIFLIYK